MSDVFEAFRVFDEDGRISGRVVPLALQDVSEGAVVIKTAFSSVNYKDALAATGAGKIMRRFPLVGGIDVSGTVVSSSDARFTAGDEVLVTPGSLAEEAAEHDDPVERVGPAHQRRVQRIRHLRDHREADEPGEHEDRQVRDQH